MQIMKIILVMLFITRITADTANMNVRIKRDCRIVNDFCQVELLLENYNIITWY